MPESSKVLQRLLVQQMQEYLSNNIDYSPSLTAAGISTPAEAWDVCNELSRRCSLLSQEEITALVNAAGHLTGTLCLHIRALLVYGSAELADGGGDCLLCLHATFHLLLILATTPCLC
jgi:hypothetical protein